MKTFIFNHPTLGRIDIEEMSISSLLQLYLITSYVYYKIMDNLIPDEVYDKVATILLNNYEEVVEIQERVHGRILVTKEDLNAGTLYALQSSEYPIRVKVAADMWLREIWDEKTDNGYKSGE